MKTTKEKEGENDLDEKEKEHFRHHEYFEDVLNNIKYEDIQTKEQHYKFLLLSLLVQQRNHH